MAAATSATGQTLSRMDPPRTPSFNGNRSCAGVQKNERTSSAAQNAASKAAKIARQDWENSGAGEGIRTLDPDLGKVVPSVCTCLLDFAHHCFCVDKSSLLIVDRCPRLRRFAPSC